MGFVNVATILHTNTGLVSPAEALGVGNDIYFIKYSVPADIATLIADAPFPE